MKIQLFTIILILEAFLSSLNGVEGKECRSSRDCDPGSRCERFGSGFIFLTNEYMSCTLFLNAK